KRIPAEHALELLVLAPDLRLEAGSVGGEVADDVPTAVAEAQLLADTHVREAPYQLRADADLALTRREPATLGDLDVRPYVEGPLPHTSRDHIGDGEGIGDASAQQV